jgi:hypothetical protein
MKLVNELPNLFERAQFFVRALRDDTRLSNEEIEMEAVSEICDELLDSIDLTDRKELKRALRNMYFLGQLK